MVGDPEVTAMDTSEERNDSSVAAKEDNSPQFSGSSPFDENGELKPIHYQPRDVSPIRTPLPEKRKERSAKTQDGEGCKYPVKNRRRKPSQKKKSDVSVANTIKTIRQAQAKKKTAKKALTFQNIKQGTIEYFLFQWSLTSWLTPMRIVPRGVTKKKNIVRRQKQTTLDVHTVPMSCLVIEPSPPKPLKSILKSTQHTTPKHVRIDGIIGSRRIKPNGDVDFDYCQFVRVRDDQDPPRDTPFTRLRAIQKMQQKQRHQARCQSSNPTRLHIRQHILQTLQSVNQ